MVSGTTPSPEGHFADGADRENEGASDSTGESIDFRALLRLALRTLPYLRPALRQLRPLLWVTLIVLLLGLPITMMASDLILTRMLGGEPLTPSQAWLLQLDPARFVEVDALSIPARQMLRDRLLIGTGAFTLASLPIALWAFWLILKIGQQINQLLRVQMLERVQAMSISHHLDSRIGDSVYRIFQDSAMVTNLMGMLVWPLWPLFVGATGLVIAFVYDWRLPLLLLVLYAASYALARHYTLPLRAEFRTARELNSALTSRIQESLSGIRVIKAYGAEAHSQARFEEASSRAFAGAYEARSRLALFGILAFCLTAIPGVAVSAYLAVKAREGSPLLMGMVMTFVGFATWNLGAWGDATRRFGGWARAARTLLFLWGRTQDMAVGMDRAFDHVDLAPEVQDADDAVPMPALEEGIRFEGVGFAYSEGHPVLEAIDLHAPPGTITALVGPTGSGKSTLVSLLLRFFDPDTGRITIDGVDLRQIRLESLRAHVSIALQENLLFGTTIRENIRYAEDAADDACVEAAAKVACAHDFITAQPQGYDTLLGERGAKLSTGQRQRLSIARAVIKDTPILVLDEPTASLDAETELQVMRNLARWGEGRAIFMVTHRLSTIRRADQIAYLRDGRIVECGSHDALMAREGGAYRRFVELEAAHA